MIRIYAEMALAATPTITLTSKKRTNIFGMTLQDERFKNFWNFAPLWHRKLVSRNWFVLTPRWRTQWIHWQIKSMWIFLLKPVQWVLVMLRQIWWKNDGQYLVGVALFPKKGKVTRNFCFFSAPESLNVFLIIHHANVEANVCFRNEIDKSVAKRYNWGKTQ